MSSNIPNTTGYQELGMATGGLVVLTWPSEHELD